MKFVFIIFTMFLLNNCSLNKDSKYWTEDVEKRKDNQKNYRTNIKSAKG